MSRRILKLCVASLHNILCFPDVILWKDSRLESFHGNPFPSVIHLSVIIIVIVKLLINLTVDHHHHPYHAGHHKDKDNMCVSSGLDWACPKLMWRSASMCLHSVLNFIMIIVLIKIKASNQDDHNDRSDHHDQMIRWSRSKWNPSTALPLRSATPCCSSFSFMIIIISMKTTYLKITKNPCFLDSSATNFHEEWSKLSVCVFTVPLWRIH